MPVKSLSPRARLFALMSPVILTGCQSTIPSAGIDGASFCATARAIYYWRHDTKPTIAQIREPNAVGVALKYGWIRK